MAKPVIIAKNVTHEAGGTYENVLREEGIAYGVVDVDRERVFPTATAASALVVMGGPDSANDLTPKMQSELMSIREAINLELPFFGVCLGLQTLVKAAGGDVRQGEIKEVAFRDPRGDFFTAMLTDEGRVDPLLRGLPETIPMFHLHGETVDLTPEMTLLATGTWCRNQIVRVRERMYGIQGHVELTPSMFQEWCVTDAWLTAMDRDALYRDWLVRQAELESTARAIFKNFLHIAGLL